MQSKIRTRKSFNLRIVEIILYVSSFEQSLEKARLYLFVLQVYYLPKTFLENVREIEPLHNLVGASLVRHIEQIKPTLTPIHYRNFVVAPFVVVVFVESVKSFVLHIEELHLLEASNYEEWALLRVICRQRHEISDVFVEAIRVFDFCRLFETLGIVSVQQEVASLVPSRANDFVIVVLADVPDVLIFQVVLVAPCQCFDTDRNDVDPGDSSDY